MNTYRVILEIQFCKVGKWTEEVDILYWENFIMRYIQHSQVGKLFFNANQRDDPVILNT
jgi:hypothetical protein